MVCRACQWCLCWSSRTLFFPRLCAIASSWARASVIRCCPQHDRDQRVIRAPKNRLSHACSQSTHRSPSRRAAWGLSPKFRPTCPWTSYDSPWSPYWWEGQALESTDLIWAYLFRRPWNGRDGFCNRRKWLSNRTSKRNQRRTWRQHLTSLRNWCSQSRDLWHTRH